MYSYVVLLCSTHKQNKFERVYQLKYVYNEIVIHIIFAGVIFQLIFRLNSVDISWKLLKKVLKQELC